MLSWANDFELEGVITDAERTENPPRFQGSAAQASLYTTSLADGLASAGRGFGFSSHDQPSLHRDLPFVEFLAKGEPVLPQVYNTTANPTPRLDKSEHDYRALLGPSFDARYMPTANASMVGEGGFADEATCLKSVSIFLDLVAARKFPGHSFWCWEEVTAAFWSLLERRPA